MHLISGSVKYVDIWAAATLKHITIFRFLQKHGPVGEEKHTALLLSTLIFVGSAFVADPVLALASNKTAVFRCYPVRLFLSLQSFFSPIFIVVIFKKSVQYIFDNDRRRRVFSSVPNTSHDITY